MEKAGYPYPTIAGAIRGLALPHGGVVIAPGSGGHRLRSMPSPSASIMPLFMIAADPAFAAVLFRP